MKSGSQVEQSSFSPSGPLGNPGGVVQEIVTAIPCGRYLIFIRQEVSGLKSLNPPRPGGCFIRVIG